MQVMSHGRVRRSQAEWAQTLRSCQASGLDEEEIYRREEIRLGGFRRSERRLQVTGTLADFVSMVPAAPTRTSWRLEITLPNGCELSPAVPDAMEILRRMSKRTASPRTFPGACAKSCPPHVGPG